MIVKSLSNFLKTNKPKFPFSHSPHALGPAYGWVLQFLQSAHAAVRAPPALRTPIARAQQCPHVESPFPSPWTIVFLSNSKIYEIRQ